MKISIVFVPCIFYSTGNCDNMNNIYLKKMSKDNLQLELHKIEFPMVTRDGKFDFRFATLQPKRLKRERTEMRPSYLRQNYHFLVHFILSFYDHPQF